MRVVPTLTSMLGASVISSLFVGGMFFILITITFLFNSFSLDFILPAFYLSMYAVIVSFIVIVVLGIPMVIFLSLIKKLNRIYLSALSFTLGSGLFYLLLQGKFSSYRMDIYSYFICILFGLASAVTALVFYKYLKVQS
jgi:hypothetical protein